MLESSESKLSDNTWESTKRLLPWLVAIAFFMEMLDTTILNTAVPIIAEALGVGPLSMKSVLSSYTLSLAVFIPISSWIADRYGTRRVFSAAVAIFTLGSVLCGLSNSLHWLVACRIIQGCGGALMVPVGRMTLVRAFPKSELIRAMSFVAIPALIGPMVGPLAGGLIVRYLHWRMIFFVNLPIGLAGLYLIWRRLPDFRADAREELDWVGLILFGSGIALLSYILEVFGETSLGALEILGLLGLSFALLTGYWLHARKLEHPLLRLNLLRIRTMGISVGGNLITRLGVGGLPFLLPMLYQVGMGYSPVTAGLLMMPQSFSAMVLKMSMQKVLTRFGFRRVLLVNTLLMGLAIAAFALIGIGTPIWAIVLLSGLFGFFSSLQYTSMNTLVFADISEADTGMASTIASTVQQMSLSFGVAISSLLVAVFVPDRFHSSASEMRHGLHEAFVLMGCLTVLSGFGFRRLEETDGENVSQHHMSGEG